MKKILVLLSLVFTCIAIAQDRDYTKIPQIQSKATFISEVQPDKIILSIVLSESNTKGKVTVEELEKKLIEILNKNQIEINKSLTLTDLSSNFQSYFLRKTDVHKTKNYRLELNDAASAGNIIKDLSENDISNVKLLRTEYSKLEELKIELKGKAVEKAKRQAEEMVKSLDKKVGTVLFISDSDPVVLNYLQGRVPGLNIRGANTVSSNMKEISFQEIAFDNIKVEVTVIVFFELK